MGLYEQGRQHGDAVFDVSQAADIDRELFFGRVVAPFAVARFGWGRILPGSGTDFKAVSREHRIGQAVEYLLRLEHFRRQARQNIAQDVDIDLLAGRQRVEQGLGRQMLIHERRDAHRAPALEHGMDFLDVGFDGVHKS